jgi:tetratricopeptide (TPR) repeat protein
LFAGSASILLFYFLYSSSIVLDLFGFILIALIANFALSKKKEYNLKPNSSLMLIMVLIFIIIFIFGISILALAGQRYFSNVYYVSGLSSWQKGDIDKAIINLQISASYNTKTDIYFSQLAQAYVLKIQKDLQDSKISEADKTKLLQVLGANAINSAEKATTLNPKSSTTWSSRAFIYQSLIGVSDDMQEWAEKSYKTAITFDSYNPYLETQLGILYFQKKDYDASLTQFKKALDLNQAYEIAIYYLGLVYDAKGDKNLAIDEFSKLLQIYPESQEINTIVNNLKDGKSALASPELAPEPSPENQEPPVLKEKNNEK